LEIRSLRSKTETTESPRRGGSEPCEFDSDDLVRAERRMSLEPEEVAARARAAERRAIAKGLCAPDTATPAWRGAVLAALAAVTLPSPSPGPVRPAVGPLERGQTLRVFPTWPSPRPVGGAR
jgi:hypothetical protein